MRDEAVEVGVGRALDVEGAAADVVQRLVVEGDRDVAVLEERVRAQDAVVRLDDGGGDLRRRVDGEAELGLLAVVDGEALQQERGEAGAGAAARGVEAEEALETSAVVRELADAVEDQVHDLLADGVVAAREVVCGVLLAGDQLLGVEELTVRASAHLIHHGRLQVNHHATGHVLSSAGLGEEGVEGIVPAANGLVAWHLSIGLDAVLQAEQLPASVANLDAGLADVDAKSLTHLVWWSSSEWLVSGESKQVLANKQEQGMEPPRNATDPRLEPK